MGLGIYICDQTCVVLACDDPLLCVAAVDVVPIADESSPEKGWSTEACSHFEELLFDKEQTIWGMATGEMGGVYSLRLIHCPVGHLLGELLVERGLARAV